MPSRQIIPLVCSAADAGEIFAGTRRVLHRAFRVTHRGPVVLLAWAPSPMRAQFVGVARLAAVFHEQGDARETDPAHVPREPASGYWFVVVDAIKFDEPAEQTGPSYEVPDDVAAMAYELLAAQRLTTRAVCDMIDYTAKEALA
jgi:hypothetical protein